MGNIFTLIGYMTVIGTLIGVNRRREYIYVVERPKAPAKRIAKKATRKKASKKRTSKSRTAKRATRSPTSSRRKKATSRKRK